MRGNPFLPACLPATCAGHAAQAAAREWRLTQLADVAAGAGCSRVALAHTCTDRAETLLLNLCRYVWHGSFPATRVGGHDLSHVWYTHICKVIPGPLQLHCPPPLSPPALP